MTGRGDTLTTALAEIEALLRADKVAEAIERAQGALGSGLEHPLLLNLRAHHLEQAGRVREALSDLERAQALAPADPMIANARGLCLSRLGLAADAVAAFELAARTAPNFVPAHYNLGWSSELIGDLGAAREGYRRAAELAPDHADAIAGLAFLAARRGDADEARGFAARALSLRPGLVKAILALADVEVGAGDHAAAERRLRASLDDADLEVMPQQRAIALGLLADALDGQGRYDEAFAAYEAENNLTRTLNLDAFSGSGVQTVPEFLDWVSAYFRQTAPDAWRGRPPATPAMPAASHVFLIGFPRSGTTLLETALAGARDVITLEERDALGEAVREFMSGPAALERLSCADERELTPFRELYWRRIAEFGVDARGKVFIDKMPLHTFKLPVIRKLFPDARILFAVRDPRDVVLSCFRRRFTMNPAMFEFLTLTGGARLYAATLEMFELCRERLALEPYIVRYEDLVVDFPALTREICAFIGADWGAEVETFADRARARAIATPSSTQVARGLYVTGREQWRRYEAHLEGVTPILAPWIRHFGYR